MNYRKTSAVLLLLSLIYGGWYAWQQRPVPPLQAQLLPLELADVQRVLIELPGESVFELSYESNKWIVQEANRFMATDDNLAHRMLNRLLRMKSNGLVKGLKKSSLPVVAKIVLFTAGGAEQIEFLATPDSLANTSYVRLNNVPDVYLVRGISVAELPLKFADFQQRFILDITSFGGLDSLVWITDSLQLSLLARPNDAEQLDSLYTRWQRMEGGELATNFDEIGMREIRLGSYRMYGPNRDSVQLRVYYDSLSEPPFVLWSNQFPTNFWHSVHLPFAEELIVRKKVPK